MNSALAQGNPRSESPDPKPQILISRLVSTLKGTLIRVVIIISL